MRRKLNGKVVVFKTSDVMVICPKCNYYNKMSGIGKFGTCKRCKFTIDPRVKFLYEIDKLLNFKIKERQRRRERKNNGYKKSDLRTFKNKEKI